MGEGRDDAGLIAIHCPHCNQMVDVPQIQAFEQQQMLFMECPKCSEGITKPQIDEAYREYFRKESE